MDQYRDYDILLRLIVNLVQAQAGKPLVRGEVWLNDAQTLGRKMFEHLVSLRALSNVHHFQIADNLAFDFIDHASIKVVARAAFETYLVFFFIYGGPDTTLCEFRHSIWRYAGLNDRQKLPATTTEAQRRQADEKKEMERVKPSIQASPHLCAYTDQQVKKILAGDWRGGAPWHSLGTSAGFHESYFRTVYGYLCGYSHASYISAMQVGQARTLADQKMLGDMCVSIGAKLMAHFAHAYADLFAAAKPVLSADPAVGRIVDRWRFSAADWEAATARPS
ncbi:MAG TPA: DUF5677 domain-containing protein [Candidatus Binataceae bacterium]|nr:DUF5677 domain-containing protein [Candidatus Binataceae bacterium]